MDDRSSDRGWRLPTRSLPPELTEILARIDERQQQMHGALSDALEQLKRGNERFTAITLREQEFAAALAGLRQDFSRAMLTADEAKKAIGQIRSEIAIFRSQLRMIAFIVGPAVGIIVVIISEFIKRLIWP